MGEQSLQSVDIEWEQSPVAPTAITGEAILLPDDGAGFFPPHSVAFCFRGAAVGVVGQSSEDSHDVVAKRRSPLRLHRLLGVLVSEQVRQVLPDSAVEDFPLRLICQQQVEFDGRVVDLFVGYFREGELAEGPLVEQEEGGRGGGPEEGRLSVAGNGLPD